MDARARRIIERISELFVRILGEDLVGVYVHGSLAFGCFTWETGDIDLIIVSESEPSHEAKRMLIGGIIDIEQDAPEKGVELSVLLASDCRDFRHPMPYVMHYSKAHTERYLGDMDAHILRLRGEDPDLAAHLTVMHAVGFPFMGPPVEEMFAPVPAGDYLDSIRFDIQDAADDIRENPVYVILNLCRVLAWMEDGSVLSKLTGGEWGRARLPERFVPLADAALACYRTGSGFPGGFSGESLDGFAGYMLDRIKTMEQTGEAL